ncbi:hypothetical protein C6A85_74470, partial [Mycobacterium sp. ITM-2017-0098]
RTTEWEVTEMIDEEFSRRRRDAVNVVLARFEAENARGSGMAVQGLADVAALVRYPQVRAVGRRPVAAPHAASGKR